MGEGKGRLIPVGDDLFCLDGAFNIYLLGGEEPVLFEGGLSVQYPLLEEAMEDIGVDPRRIKGAFILHTHADHVMAVAKLKAQYPQIKVYASAEAKKTLEKERVWQTIMEAERGISQAVALKEGLRVPEGAAFLQVDEVLSDGASLEFGGHRLEVIATAGHSPCSISVLLDGRVLLVSDALGGWLFRSPEGPRPSFFWSLEDYISSARRLERVPCDVLCFGHNGFIRGRERIKALFEGHWRNLEALLQEVSRVKSLEDYERLSKDFAVRWYVDFLRFFPWEFHLQAVRLLVGRTLEYLGKDAILEGS